MDGAAIAGIVGGAAINKIMSDTGANSSRPFYDYRYYYNFPDEYTDLIDSFLTADFNKDRVQIGTKIVKNGSRFIPGIGKHYFYNTDRGWLGHKYITFEKTYNTDTKNHHYMCYVWYIDTFTDAIATIFKTDDDVIHTVTLEKSRAPDIFPLIVTKFYHGYRPYQMDAINMILNHYDSNRKHCNVVFCGYRGTGKSYTAKPLKKELDKKYPGIMSRLYDDFDPTTPGITYNGYIKTGISEYIPAIVVIDEIDTCIKYALQIKDDDASYRLAQNRTSMLGLLDSMGDTKYSINIMTTELSPAQLYENPEWHSFFRPGRVDFFIEFVRGADTNHTCRKVIHDDIPGYPKL